jgi:hypothetical protein
MDTGMGRYRYGWMEIVMDGYRKRMDGWISKQ